MFGEQLECHGAELYLTIQVKSASKEKVEKDEEGQVKAECYLSIDQAGKKGAPKVVMSWRTLKV
jgi:hypothetical protein